MAEPRPKRATAEQTRNRLLDAAVEQLNVHGAPARLDQVSLEALVKLTGVPRSSAYSAWEKVNDNQTPQESFRRALMKRLIVADGVGPRDLGPLSEVLPIALSRTEGLPSLERRRELIRLAAGSQFTSAFNRPGYRLSLALTWATISAPEHEADEELLGWVRATEAAWLDLTMNMFKALAEMVDIEPAPGFDPDVVWQSFTTAVLALGEGLFARMTTSDQNYLMGIPGPGPADTDELWTLYAIGVDALTDRFFVFTDQATGQATEEPS